MAAGAAPHSRTRWPASGNVHRPAVVGALAAADDERKRARDGDAAPRPVLRGDERTVGAPLALVDTSALGAGLRAYDPVATRLRMAAAARRVRGGGRPPSRSVESGSWGLRGPQADRGFHSRGPAAARGRRPERGSGAAAAGGAARVGGELDLFRHPGRPPDEIPGPQHADADIDEGRDQESVHGARRNRRDRGGAGIGHPDPGLLEHGYERIHGEQRATQRARYQLDREDDRRAVEEDERDHAPDRRGVAEAD